MKENELIKCPFCYSDNWYKIRKTQWSTAIIILLFGIPILFPSKWKHCFDCDKDFKA